ncbi:MAG TPA: YqgE/AlgH family protein [Pirellulales bacterium]
MELAAGHLLVASTQLQDPNFTRTVVLMIRLDDDGAFGLILNRPTNTPFSEVWTQVGEGRCARTNPLHFGGPVEGPLFALHGDPLLSDVQIQPGLHFTTDPEHLKQLALGDQEPVKFIVGYAGWGAEQLRREIHEGSWLNGPAKLDHVFAPLDQDLWNRVNRELVQNAIFPALKINRLPDDPTVN